MKKARCRRCMNLNYDFFTRTYEDTYDYFCGLHGRAPVDPDGEQSQPHLVNYMIGCIISLKKEVKDD